MIRYFNLFLILCFSLTVFGQGADTLIFSTDFENGGLQPPNMDTTNHDTLHGQDWGINSSLFSNGSYSDSAKVHVGDTLYLTSKVFSASGFDFVSLEFDHICKVSFFDKAIVRVSNDSGATWTDLGQQYYSGFDVANGGPFWFYNGFNETSYSNAGDPWLSGCAGCDTVVPLQTWWKSETFNVSPLLADSSECFVQFALGPGIATTGVVHYGWLVDSLKVRAAPCELIPPRAQFSAPFITNGSVIFSLGPYDIRAKIWDEHSSIDTSFLFYTVNGGPVDSVPMGWTATTPADSIYLGTIPKIYNGVDSFKTGDTICYWITAYDSSINLPDICRNAYSIPDDPSITCNTFYANNGVQLPFCDNFDDTLVNFWTDSNIVSGVGWQRNQPTLGGYSAYSAPWSYITYAGGNYSNNDEYYLESPVFDFTTAVTPRMSFYQKRDMPGGGDGDRFTVEFRLNGGTWLQLGNFANPAGIPLDEPNCPSTWYNQSTGWNNSTSGWTYTFYQLPALFTGVSQAEFRFKFKADAGGNSFGISIDDFCLENPPQIDASVIEIIRPTLDFLKVQGDTDSVSIIVRNIGLDTLYTVPAGYHIDTNGSIWSSATQTFNIPTGIAPLARDTFKFSTQFIIPEANYKIVAYPLVVGDADSDNDSLETDGHFGFITDTIDYFTDFESWGNKPKWTTTNAPVASCGNPPDPTPTRWYLGTPNFGATNSTYSGVNSWGINLDSAYNNSATEYLYTQFFDFSNANMAMMSFWHNRNTPVGEDGYRVEYSLNNSGLWFFLTNAGPGPQVASNWFTGASLATGLGDGWSGNSNGWEYSEHPLVNTVFQGQSQVQFRFAFRSDGANVLDGVSIDDFRIINPELYDLEMTEFVLPQRGCVLDIEEPVSFTFRNIGLTTMDTIPVAFQYNFNGGPFGQIYRDTVYDTVGINQYYTHLFKDSIDMSIFGTYCFRGWIEHPLDEDQSNDSLFGYCAENVEGCEVGVTITTGLVAPDGIWYIQDKSTGDTIHQVPFSTIGANAIGWTQSVCLDNIGNYFFNITSTDTSMISYWGINDLFADTIVKWGIDPDTASFHWECPPLLSASSSSIRPVGPSRLNIPQNYELVMSGRNRGSFNLRYVWVGVDIQRIAPSGAVGPILSNIDSVNFVCNSNCAGAPTPRGISTLTPFVHTFDTTWNAEPGVYQICTWTFLPNGNPDHATWDDTTCLTFVVLDTLDMNGMPYCSDFDNTSTQNPWGSFSKTSYDTLSSFKWGVPNQTAIVSNGTNSWMTGLSNDYPVLDSSAIYSPMFDLDSSVCYKLSFDHNYNTEYAFDGGVVEYSIDSGETWVTIGDFEDSLSAENWYNTPYVVGLTGAPNSPGFTGKSNGWRSAYHDIKFPDYGQDTMRVVFRFRFGSDGSWNDEGWAIDNFCLDTGSVCKFVSCFDGILNNQEEKIDCGGPNCIPCPSCNDGILNQNEKDIDCGGVCPPCPSCFDLVQNGAELGLDCGGPDCPACGNCNDGIRNGYYIPGGPDATIPPIGWSWVEEVGVDCGGPCEACWVGVDEIDNTKLVLGKSIPNPAKDFVIFKYNLPSSGMATIKVTSTLGIEVYNEQFNQAAGIHEVKVDVSGWSAGVYQYSIEFGDENINYSMVVVK